MTTYIQAVVKLNSVSGLDRDKIENTFNFKSETAPDYGALATRLQHVYDFTHAPGIAPLKDFMSPTVARSGHEIDFYDVSPILAGTGPRGAPVSRATGIAWSGLAVSTPLPQEVACCLSYHADYGALSEDTPAGAPGPAGDVHGRARVRGRVFFGPFNQPSLSTSGGRPQVSGTVIDILCGIGDFLLLAGAGDPIWCVWSRKAGDMYPVVKGWVDDEWDTQRRRQQKAQYRQLWPTTV